MGDYSWCNFQVATDKAEEVSKILLDLGTVPEGIDADPRRYPNGEAVNPITSYEFEEVKSGLDGLSHIFDELERRLIPYRAFDDGCPGVWGEEEVKFIVDPQPFKASRLLFDGTPFITIRQWMGIRDDPDILEIIDGHLSKDPTKWL